MRPVRFVALSEDGQALVLADEVGRLLALPLDERISGALHAEPGSGPVALTVAGTGGEPTPSLSPATSKRASALVSRLTTSRASPVCRSTASCGTPGRSSRSGRCSLSTPGVRA
ncbi:hypothetical protein Pflav_075530 [Phytohabitans flavus]|uniref:Uncharacterized protein n=1 Tax=Phytohabitans flavus TaxID=1076124 RepID=A0A6F8Y534_9ACTN|nr:hypothetical protein Pflav_075530 [Phytohabitans flavus]